MNTISCLLHPDMLDSYWTDVVGILDVDWQSLMSTNTAMKPKPSSSTDALERFSPANILSRIGISKKYAGQERVDKVQNLLNQHNGGSLSPQTSAFNNNV